MLIYAISVNLGWGKYLESQWYFRSRQLQKVHLQGREQPHQGAEEEYGAREGHPNR